MAARQARSINMCTPIYRISPEHTGRDSVRLEFACMTGRLNVTACEFYKTFRVGGMDIPYECDHSHAGCTCRKAQAEAKARGERILKIALSK